MKIVITGNLGYVGSVLTRHLRTVYSDATIVGFDTGFFAHCLTGARRIPETLLDSQVYGDVRNMPDVVLEGADALVQLAAISNDPMGKEFEAVTQAINFEAGCNVAKRARDLGVRNIIFASSCSVYGCGGNEARTEESEVSPLTAYARSKIDQENALMNLAGNGTVATCLRFATACGMSDRLRLDLVLNDFVASALTTGKISVLSDGSPWRPLIHVADMARAIEWAIQRPADNGGEYLVVNAGSNQWNYQVRELAHAVADETDGTEVFINTDAAPDKRSYRVCFDRFAELAPDYQPQVNLTQAVQGLMHGLRTMNFHDVNFRESDLIRLRAIKSLRKNGMLDEHLFWHDCIK